ncbi:CAP-Gly domain-containing linker protein 3-like [Erpetoichthys calabaricus]|uniref:CAP-Gly domain-containing linker protein 3-like n=1 Tax=Erpetoichthys calabaricus TaxID=27687 RepID=UPI002233F81F|nr:CAP-Gly domain-containing linker protein 3-like [Erpetoichthys calabaricus]
MRRDSVFEYLSVVRISSFIRCLRMCQMGAPRPPLTDESVSGKNLKLEEGPSGAEDFTTEEVAEEMGLGSEAEQAGVEAPGRAEGPLKDIGGQYAERKKPLLKLGERVVLGRGRKGVVRFIGQLESINSKEIYVGVELDIPCGENDGKTKGKRYFTCRPYHGTFAQMSAVKSCKPLAAAGCTPNGPDTSDSDEGGSSSTDTRNVRRILRRTRNQMNINSPVRCKQPPGANEQTSDQGSRIPALVDFKGLPKMSPIV